MLLRILTALLVTFLVSTIDGQTVPSTEATVKGQVTEAAQGSSVNNVSVDFIDSAGNRFRATTDLHGLFRLSAPAGVYRVELAPPGFFRMRRSPIVLIGNETISLDLTLLLYELTRIRSLSNRESEICTNAKEPDELILGKGSGSVYTSMIYGEKRDESGKSRFRGVNISLGDCSRVTKDAFNDIITPDKYLPLIITHNRSSIQADEAVLLNDDSTLRLTGNVRFFDGTTTWHGHELTVDVRTFVILDREVHK